MKLMLVAPPGPPVADFHSAMAGGGRHPGGLIPTAAWAAGGWHEGIQEIRDAKIKLSGRRRRGFIAA